jgi:hypothetical protein
LLLLLLMLMLMFMLMLLWDAAYAQAVHFLLNEKRRTAWVEGQRCSFTSARNLCPYNRVPWAV